MTHVDTLRMIASLLGILALIFALAWLTRRTGWLRARSTQTLRLISTQSLGSRATLALVQVQDTQLVLGVTAAQVSLLHTLPATDAAQAQHDGGTGDAFAAVLQTRQES